MHSTTNNVNSVLNLLHNCGCVIGTAPYSKKLNKNGFHFVKNQSKMTILLHLTLLITLQTVLITFSELQWQDSETNKIYAVITISKQVNQIIGTFLTWKYQHYFLEAFYNIFCLYQLNQNNPNTKNGMLRIKIYIAACYLFSVLSFIIGILVLSLNESVNLALYALHGLEFQYSCSVMICLTSYILMILPAIDDVSEDIKLCKSSASLKLIGLQYGFIHKGTKSITKSFSLFVPTVIIINLCNIIYVTFTSKELFNISKAILDVAFTSLLIYFAETLNTGNKITRAVSRIDKRKEELDYATARSIILLQMAQEEIEISAGGCFSLSFRDIVEQAGMCISIILFLMQILN